MSRVVSAFDPFGPEMQRVSLDRGRTPYVFTEQMVLAVNVAISTERPLLVVGPPSSGKTSLAGAIARVAGYRYYEYDLRSRTRVDDLCYSFDDRRRLADAASARTDLLPVANYVEPGPIWWAFNAESARRRGAANSDRVPPAADPAGGRLAEDVPAVVLLDAIERTDQDFLLDLRAVIGSKSFVVRETSTEVRARQPVLLMLVSDGERELPASLVRFCVFLALAQPTTEQLAQIGRVHFPNVPTERLDRLAARVMDLTIRRSNPVRIGDYLGAVRVLESMGMKADEESRLLSQVLMPAISAQPIELAERPIEVPRPSMRTAKVFLNYAREDAEVARRLFDDLRNGGFDPWMDKESLLPGQKWRPAIERAIRASNFFIALISPRSVTKRGFVQKEIKVAFEVLEEMPENQVFLIPVRIGDVEPPEGPMQELHWMDLEPYEEGLQRILSVMQLVPSERQ